MSKVQQWEKDLTLISEIIDEWISVQRKWLYLEGIFIDGDISSQLPEEAKNFNTIDEEFREVSYDKNSGLPTRTMVEGGGTLIA